MIWFKNPEKSVAIHPTTIISIFLLIASVYFIFQIRQIVIMLFLAFLLMTALNPGVRKLEKKYGLSRTLGILIMYLLVISLVIVTFVLIVPPLVSQLQTLLPFVNFPLLQDELRNFKFTLSEASALVNGIGTSFSTVMIFISTAFNGLFTFFTILVLSFYMLLDRDNLYKRLAWISRDRRHLEKAKQFVDDTEVQLGGWVRGQLILMAIIGVGSYLGYFLLGVPFALPLALLAGLLEILPNLGPTLAAIPAIFLAFTAGGPILALIVLIFNILIQQLEINLVVPKVMSANADVSPLATIVTILVGLKVAGMMGALLSVPVYIVVRSLYSYWIRHSSS